MRNLAKLFRTPLREVPSSAVIFVLIVALVGFVDAMYLTIEHFRGVIPPCSITGGCEKVLTSFWAAPLGIPVSLVGAIFYLVIVIGAFMYLESRHVGGGLRSHHSSILKWTMLLTILGFLASLWFVYLQIFIIHSYCAYCLGSAITSTILFVTAMNIFGRYQNQ